MRQSTCNSHAYLPKNRQEPVPAIPAPIGGMARGPTSATRWPQEKQGAVEMQSMSSSSDETKATPARHVRSGLRRLFAVAIVLLAISVGAVVLWEKYGGMDASSPTAAELTASTPTTTETAETSDMTSQVLKELQN